MLLRAMLIQTIGETKIKINSMETKNKTEERSEIVADITLEEENDDIDHIITRFTIEPGVFYIGYKKQKSELMDDDEN